MEEYLLQTIYCLIAAVLGFLGGQGAVVIFNRVPGSWLCDYGYEPEEELLHPTSQRIKSTPWKFVFSGILMLVGVICAWQDPRYGLVAMVLTWLLIEISAADIKYRIIPDQFALLAAVCGFGFIGIGPDWKDMIYGLVAGGLLMLAVALAGKLLLKKEALGMGDVKLMAALGLCFGLAGILKVFCMMAFISAAAGIVLMMARRADRDTALPLAPCISAAAVIYMAVPWQVFL